MASLNGHGFFRADLSAQFASSRTREEPAAHSNPAMDPPAIDRQPCFSQSALPGENVSIDSVDQCAIKIKDERSHEFSLYYSNRTYAARASSRWLSPNSCQR